MQDNESDLNTLDLGPHTSDRQGKTATGIEEDGALAYFGDRPTYNCANCSAHLALQDELISKAFSGREGVAFLFHSAVNIKQGKKEDRMLLTGMHTVADITCAGCDTNLGWTYLKAFEASQKYKEGKFIIEKEKIVKDNAWNLDS